MARIVLVLSLIVGCASTPQEAESGPKSGPIKCLDADGNEVVGMNNCLGNKKPAKSGGTLTTRGGAALLRGPKVIPGRAEVTGCLELVVVGRVVSRVHKQAAHCYKKELESSPELGGKITATFEIDADGVAGGCSVEAAAELESVGQCMCRIVDHLRLPSCAEGTKVSYPWILKPR